MSITTSIPTPDLLSPSAAPSAETMMAQSQLTQPTALEALEHYKKKDPSKVVVRFKAIGSAPIMKNNVFKATAGHKFQAVILFLRQQLGMKKDEPLYTYINAAFAPAPDDTVGNLFKCFGTEGHLIVNYSNTQAWG
ncbi:ubiquitin-like protein ATG12 [Kwoniella dejecticola CBS 10117]|uniref:Ubiquitin-like protein ATG12 n=1 Tax=Kwoniella dejecticola CBS 10117 TaxID=1296121 RepID=A0AAJ8MK77_9TREE